MKIPELFDALRKSTSELLGLGGVDGLTPVQSLKVDLASSLRLELDRLMAQQLKGEAVDLRALTVASEMLERLLRPAAIEAAADPFADARVELERFLNARADAIEAAKDREAKAEAARQLPEPQQQPPRSQPPTRPTRVTYVDSGVLDEPALAPPPTPKQPEREEWRNVYSTPFGVHNIPRRW